MPVAPDTGKGSGVKLKWPASCKVITQKYGNRSARYISGRHTGLDIGCKAGSPIYAAHDGTVTYSGYNGAYGNEVRVQLNSSFVTSYHHMSRRKAVKGDVVSAGNVIGYIGSTGQSTGPHLHFEIRVNGKHTDPEPYLSGASVPGGATQAGFEQAGITDSLKKIWEVLGQVAKVFAWLSEPMNWLRIFMVLAGAALLLIALVGFGKTMALAEKAGNAIKDVGKKAVKKK